MSQETINNAYNEYPWASDVTMEKLSKVSTSNAATTVALSNMIAQAAGKDYQDRLRAVLERNKKANKSALERGEDFYSQLKDSFSKTLNANNPSALYDSMRDTSLKDAADELAEAMPANKFGRAMGSAVQFASKAAGGAGIALMGLTAVIKMAAGHQKELNDGMNFGMIGRLDEMTNLKRISYTAIGSFDEMRKISNASLPAFTNMAGDSLSGARQFAYFAAQAEAINVRNGKGDFGLGIEQFATALAGEAELLYQLNEVEALDAEGKKRITRSFESVMGITSFMAGAFGEQRDAMLQEREANLTDVDFMDAYVQSTETHIEKYGEAALENSREGYNTLITMLNALNMPPDFVENVKGAMNRARADLEYDAEVVNNATPEFIEQLNLSGFGPEFLDLMNTVLVGKDITPPEVVNALGGIFQKAHDEGIMLMGTDEASVKQRELLVSIMNITDARFSEMSKASEAYIDMIEDDIESTDDFVDAADALKQIKGEFASLTTVSYEVTSAIGKVVNWFLSLFTKENRYANMTTDQIIADMYGDGDQEAGAEIQQQVEGNFDRNTSTMKIYDRDGAEYEVQIFYENSRIVGVQNLTDPTNLDTLAILQQQTRDALAQQESVTAQYSNTEDAKTEEGKARLIDMAQESARLRLVMQELNNFSNFGQRQVDFRMSDVGIVMQELQDSGDQRYAELKQAYDELLVLQQQRPEIFNEQFFTRGKTTEEQQSAAARLAELNAEITREYEEFTNVLLTLGIDQELDALNGR